MRASVVNRSQVPVGINLLTVPLASWNLWSGAVYLPDEDAVLLPAAAAGATSPWVRVDQPTTIIYSEEWWMPTSGRRNITATYADRAQQQIGNNGNNLTVDAETWTPFDRQFPDTGVNRLSESTWTRWTYRSLDVPGSKFRNPTLTITR